MPEVTRWTEEGRSEATTNLILPMYFLSFYQVNRKPLFNLIYQLILISSPTGWELRFLTHPLCTPAVWQRKTIQKLNFSNQSLEPFIHPKGSKLVQLFTWLGSLVGGLHPRHVTVLDISPQLQLDFGTPHTSMSTKTERACMLCGIIQPYRSFLEKGCPNCESVLHYADNEDGQIQDCTSPSFEGLVALGDDNKASWVARWLRIDSFVHGIYAVKVNGKLPPHIISELEEQNISYRPRDGSAED